MDAVITALTTGLTPAVFFGIVADIVPFIITMVPIALGLYFLRKLVKGAGKGKVKFWWTGAGNLGTEEPETI